MMQAILTGAIGSAIYVYVKNQLDFYQWKTEFARKIAAFIAVMVWAVAFGILCAYTGFLR
jgi:hypothetical protein